MYLSIIGWIVLGGLAGWIASIILGAREGLVGSIVVGIIGAFIGGFIVRLFGSSGVTGFNLSSLFTATLGAIVLLVLMGAVRGRRHAV